MTTKLVVMKSIIHPGISSEEKIFGAIEGSPGTVLPMTGRDLMIVERI